MLYNKELAKRFISDFNLPIPLINEELFFYHLNLYEDDYKSLSRYIVLELLINTRFNGDCNKFLEEYYNIREAIITTVSNSEAFQKFNTMDMKAFTITDKLNITDKNIYHQDNIGKFFISIDLKQANFHTLKKIDKDIVLGADTYEDFIGTFTDLDYVKKSKNTRQEIFGKLNPNRHMTAEKYFITEIYKKVIDVYPYINGHCVCMSADEIIFNIEFLRFNDKLFCYSFRSEIERIAQELGFKVHVEFFHLYGFNLLFKESKSVRDTFYIKEYFATEGKFKLIAAPLPYHAIMYKLYNGIPLVENDYHFNYEGINARICEDFTVEMVKI